jgi:uncharacterized protein YheU (UPF0270 family)
METDAKHVVVPHDALSAEALANLIEDFITREGTDYGEREHTADEKRAAVKHKLERGTIVIVFDLESESASLVNADEWKSKPRRL